jgi:hypothetical protein
VSLGEHLCSLVTTRAIILVLSCLAPGLAKAQNSPTLAEVNPTRLFWGDTHLHTNQSADAFTMGNQRITPDDAYRFARGETVTSQTGVKARLARPLDFLMISDHAEFMGVFPLVFSGSPTVTDSRLGKRWGEYLKRGEAHRIIMEFAMLSMGIGRAEDLQQYLDESHGIDMALLESLRGLDVEPPLQRSIWAQAGDLADEFNEPGLFTAFIGYEWTSTPGGNNLHRNVMFRDGANKASTVVPFSAVDSSDPEALWDFMAAYEKKTGGKVLAIPHNGNLSNGLMFAETQFSGEPVDLEYAQKRARWEPVVEVTQVKGDGEAHPFLSPNDEFADYETWDRFNLFTTTPKQQDMLQFEYARSALKNGLSLEETVGANPYRFGMIGSTDSHNALATADEDNYFGKNTRSEPAAGRGSLSFAPEEYAPNVQLLNWELAGSGYAAVWASDNTRESLFDAIMRKETYATTGPRMTVRFFGGWHFEAGDDQRSDMTSLGYNQGVPMGGELPARNGNDGPRFIVSALRDPVGANLDRLQIIKGWVDRSGQTREKVYNVAASDSRALQDNKLSTVGNTVDTAIATYRNSIGDAHLATVWRDPDFDPQLRAFYYLRVIEIPTPRWTTHDAAEFGGPTPEGAPLTIQERAYTSPIWYKPSNKQ